MTDWDNFGPGRNGPYQKIKVVTVIKKAGVSDVEYDRLAHRTVRICNRCGILYVQKDFNNGLCPIQCRAFEAFVEIQKELQDRQEETA